VGIYLERAKIIDRSEITHDFVSNT